MDGLEVALFGHPGSQSMFSLVFSCSSSALAVLVLSISGTRTQR